MVSFSCLDQGASFLIVCSAINLICNFISIGIGLDKPDIISPRANGVGGAEHGKAAISSLLDRPPSAPGIPLASGPTECLFPLLIPIRINFNQQGIRIAISPGAGCAGDDESSITSLLDRIPHIISGSANGLIPDFATELVDLEQPDVIHSAAKGFCIARDDKSAINSLFYAACFIIQCSSEGFIPYLLSGRIYLHQPNIVHSAAIGSGSSGYNIATISGLFY